MMKYLDVIQWDPLEVSAWLASRGFQTDLQVSGDVLLELSEKEIRHFVGNGIVRKRLARDLRNLKKSLNYTNSEAEQTAEVLASSSLDLVEHTHRLVTSGLSVEHIDLVDNIPLRLTEAGIENNLQLMKIQALLEREQNKLKGKVHITCDSRSQTFGSLVDIYLKLRGFQTTGMRDDSRKESDSERILDSECLVVVMTNTECLQTSEEGIQDALQNGLTVVLVVEERLNLNEVSWNLEDVKVVRWIHDYQGAVIDRIEKIINTGKTLENKMKTRSISVDSGINDC